VVWSGASNNTIWGEPKNNYLFRAWHDSIHIKHSLDFTISNEIQASKIQCEIASRLIGDNFADIIDAEARGQVLYYDKYGEFPTDQESFIRSFIKSGGIV